MNPLPLTAGLEKDTWCDHHRSTASDRGYFVLVSNQKGRLETITLAPLAPAAASPGPSPPVEKYKDACVGVGVGARDHALHV